MKNKIKLKFLAGVLIAMPILFSVACSKETEEDKKSSAKVEGRWYTNLQVASGRKVFKNNCAVCHGDQGQGIVADWRKTLPDGSYPPPPLNGSAHTWHHSKQQLLRTINTGGAPVGGTMPAFEQALTDREKAAVMAYFMSLWPERIYKAWEQRNAG